MVSLPVMHSSLSDHGARFHPADPSILRPTELAIQDKCGIFDFVGTDRSILKFLRRFGDTKSNNDGKKEHQGITRFSDTC